MSAGTTNINELPPAESNMLDNPIQNNIYKPPIYNSEINTENIKVENYGEHLNSERQVASQLPLIDYTSQLTSSLRDAKASGATVLPSRDIPQHTLPIQQDYQTKANYVPEVETNDYIGNILNKEKSILQQKQKQNYDDNLDYIYQNIQIPFLICILYFLFQLPFIRKNLLTFLPNLFNSDGNPKLSGYIFNSVVFALLYALLIQTLQFFQNNL
jgi:hypothetical protein